MNLDGYRLVWSDEFDGDGIDFTKWSNETGGHGWGNNELQYYTKNAGNSFVRDGVLHLTAKKEDFEKNNYTSGKLSTYGKASWKYCYVEARAKVPYGAGTWPAIWMLSDAINEGTHWPLCGEIDILEHVGRFEGDIYASLHSQLYNHSAGTQQNKIVNFGDVWSDFHTYAVEWTEDYAEFLFDGKSYAKFEKGEDGKDTSDKGWPFNKNFFIILNLAVGGNFGGPVTDESTMPWTFEIDYVRVYQKI